MKKAAKVIPVTRLGRDVFTTGQAAKICGVAPRSIMKWCDGGSLRHHRLPYSQDRRIYRSDLVAFLTAAGMRVPVELLPLAVVATGSEALCVAVAGAYPAARRVSGLAQAALLVGGGGVGVLVVDAALGLSEALDLARTLEGRPERPPLLACVLHDDGDPGACLAAGFDRALPAHPATISETLAKLTEGGR